MFSIFDKEITFLSETTTIPLIKSYYCGINKFTQIPISICVN